jgi:hypothetical protein
VAFKRYESGGTPCIEFRMVRKLEEKDKDFRDELAHTPDYHLDEPRPDVHILIRINVIIIEWNIFVSVHSAFQSLHKELH